MTDAIRFRRAAPLVVLLAVACSSDPTNSNGNGPKAELTVVHASPGIGLIDVRVANVSVVSGLAYGRSSGVRQVAAGASEIVVRASDSVIARFSANLTADQATALTIGEDTTQMSNVMPDTGIAVSNRANVRLVNVVGPTTANPTQLSLRLNFPGVSAESTAVIGLDTRIASHGPLMYFDPGHFRAAFVAQGSTTVLAQTEFDVAAGKTAIIVLERNAAGAYVVRIVTAP